MTAQGVCPRFKLHNVAMSLYNVIVVHVWMCNQAAVTPECGTLQNVPITCFYWGYKFSFTIPARECCTSCSLMQTQCNWLIFSPLTCIIHTLPSQPATSSWRGLPTTKQPSAVPGRKKSATVHQHIGWQHTRRYGGAVQSNAVHLLSWFWVERDSQRLLCPLHHHWWWRLVRWYCCGGDRTVSCSLNSGVAWSLSSSPVAYSWSMQVGVYRVHVQVVSHK